jgi:hypothetical protein
MCCCLYRPGSFVNIELGDAAVWGHFCRRQVFVPQIQWALPNDLFGANAQMLGHNKG